MTLKGSNKLVEICVLVAREEARNERLEEREKRKEKRLTINN